MAFLLNTILLPDGSEHDQASPSRTADVACDALPKHHIPPKLVAILTGEEGLHDEDFEEKAARTLMCYLEVGGKLRQEDSTRMSARLQKRKHDKEWGLTQQESRTLTKLCMENVF